MTKGRIGTDTQPTIGRVRGGLFAATGLIMIALVITTLIALAIDHGRASDVTAQSARNISHLLREHARRTFGEVDRTLINLSNAVSAIRKNSEPHLLPRALHYMSAGLQQVDAFVIADQHGQVLHGTAPLLPATADALADTLTRAPLDDLTVRYLGPDSGAPGLPGAVIMARPVLNANGTLAGWTAAVLNQQYFTRFYESVDVGPNGLIAIIHTRGPILFRTPFKPGIVGTDVSSRPLFTRHLATSPEGQFRIHTGTDGVDRIQAYALLEEVPLVVLVGVTTDHAYAAWQKRALWLGGLALLAAVVVMALSLMLNRQVRILQTSERRTREAESHLSRAQAIAHVGSWEWNLHDNSMWWSHELHRIYDLPEDGEPPSYGRFLQAVHPEDRAMVASTVARALDDGLGFSIEYRVRRSDGTDLHVRHEGQCVLNANGSVQRMDSVVQDTTESIQLQVQLAQAGKLSTLGEMAAGMAHELSQPLNILRMAAEGALMRLGQDTDDGDAGMSRQALQQVSDQADRMAQIIDHIRIFSRKDTAPTQVFDARTAVRLATDMMDRHLAGSGIRLSVDLPTSSAPVKGRPVQLEQVIVNLLANAKDSIIQRRSNDRATDGSVAIGHVSLSMRRVGSSVEISIQDDGAGVPPGLFGRIFEPFFSTKGVGEGTGLGLSVSYGIITGMGGGLAATNRPRGGASFDISLPLQVGSVGSSRDFPAETIQATASIGTDMEVSVPSPQPPPQAEDTPTGLHLVTDDDAPLLLLVEEHPGALSAVHQHMVDRGYRIAATSGGDHAWRRFMAQPADMVVTDLDMAGGDGEALVRRLREIDPFLPIIIVAGDRNTMDASGLDDQDPNTRVLTKPLSLSSLDDTLGTLLRRSA